MSSSPVVRTTSARIPTKEGEFQLFHYIDTRGPKEHLALVLGEISGGHEVLARVHSECFTGDVLGSQRCDCGEQLQSALSMIASTGAGIIIYLRQEGRGIGLEQKLRAYNLQDQGYDTVDANLLLGHQADEREYSAAAAILRDLSVHSIRLLTNNPSKIAHLTELGVTITLRVPLEVGHNRENAAYLRTKVERMQHMLTLPGVTDDVPADLARASVPVADRIRDLTHRAHVHYAATSRPFVTLSYAQSLDGCIAARPGEHTAISSPSALRVTHALRAAHDAILVGIGTVLADDPQLTVRMAEGDSPQPIVLDSRLRLPLTARVLKQPRPVWVAATDPDPVQVKLLAGGIRLLQLPSNGDQLVDLNALLDRLGALGIRSLMVEGGARVLSSFLTHGCAHFAAITISPVFLGGLRSYSVAEAPVGAGRPVPSLVKVESINVGPDIMLWGEVADQTRLPLSAPHTTASLPLA